MKILFISFFSIELVFLNFISIPNTISQVVAMQIAFEHVVSPTYICLSAGHDDVLSIFSAGNEKN